jgi:uncharacterized protein with ParB-like and HNH nuclease domain
LGKKQCSQLFEDIKEIKTPNNTHFIGSIIYSTKEIGTDNEKRIIIDGHQ